MPTNYDNLKTAWTARIETAHTAGSLEDEDYYEALALLDQWIASFTKLASVSGSDMAGYSIAGRSVTKRDMAGFREDVNRARAALMNMLFGLVSLADFRVDETLDPKTNT